MGKWVNWCDYGDEIDSMGEKLKGNNKEWSWSKWDNVEGENWDIGRKDEFETYDEFAKGKVSSSKITSQDIRIFPFGKRHL